MLVDQFDAVLFDADETLFSFDSFSGLQRLFANYGSEFTEQDFQEYQAVNQPLWVDYQEGRVTSAQLQVRRFENCVDKLKVPAAELNQGFLQAMAEICTPLPGAEALLAKLAPHVELGIITNGFQELLTARLQRTGFDSYFQVLTVSELFGVAKPHPSIFQHSLEQLTSQDAGRVLMVGDTPESDILGGINAGMKTCWLDHGVRQLNPGIQPSYQVKNLTELSQLLFS